MRECVVCLTGDHRVLTRRGWRSIKHVKEGDEVQSFNIATYAMEWKPVTAVTSHDVDPSKAADTLYRMQGSGMDVIATRDHRMLLARLDWRTASGLSETQAVGYETVGELLQRTYEASSTLTSSHDNTRAVVCAGLNTQPAVKVVLAGLERLCEWWWAKDQQLGLLSFLGFWLADGHLDSQASLVCIEQTQEAPSEWLEQLLDAVFPRWWDRQPAQTPTGAAYSCVIHCPPLYEYLRLMAVGPVGYNPRDSAQLRSYPHFIADNELAAQEQQSDCYQPAAARHASSTWSEDVMLAAFSAGSPPSSTRSLSSSACGGSDGDEIVRDEPIEQGEKEMEPPAEASVVVDAAQAQAKQAAGAAMWRNSGLRRAMNGQWFSLKRWLGEDNIASVYSRLSRVQAVALLDGFCRAGGVVQYDDECEPTGVWECSSCSSFPLVDQLQLIGQLAGAAVDLRLHAKAGTTTVEGHSDRLSVDQWQLCFSFSTSAHGLPMQTAALAQPVDVSDDVDARGYHDYEDDGRVYCISVDSDGDTNANFLTQRLSSSKQRTASGTDDSGLRARAVFVGNCLDAPATHIILDCFHLCLCEGCAERMNEASRREGKEENCPKCRAVVRLIHKTY